MIYTDHHMHTIFSPDASKSATIDAYIKAAEKSNVQKLIFTDHMDFDSPDPLFQTLIDYDAYFEVIKKHQTKTNVSLNVGVEIGYQPHLKKRLKAFINQYPFHFVIASIHIGDGLDFYNGDFFKDKTKKEAIKRYYEIVLEMVKNYDDFDVIGHLDYIIRYGNIKKEDYNVNDYMPLIKEILKTIIAKNKGLELNTSGLRYKLGFIHPMDEILTAYQELGGEILTLGSDAHAVNDYQADFSQAIDKLKRLGFKTITEYKNRQAKPIKL